MPILREPISLSKRPEFQNRRYSEYDDRLFYEGDFRNPEKGITLGQKIGIVAGIGLGLWWGYRGMRGAGYVPFRSTFFRPLSRTAPGTGYVGKGLGKSANAFYRYSKALEKSVPDTRFQKAVSFASKYFSRGVKGIKSVRSVQQVNIENDVERILGPIGLRNMSGRAGTSPTLFEKFIKSQRGKIPRDTGPVTWWQKFVSRRAEKIVPGTSAAQEMYKPYWVPATEHFKGYKEPGVIAELERRGYGLRTPGEAISSLFSRTISGEFLEYMGVPRKSALAKGFRGAAKWILGGDVGSRLGFQRSITPGTRRLKQEAVKDLGKWGAKGLFRGIRKYKEQEIGSGKRFMPGFRNLISSLTKLAKRPVLERTADALSSRGARQAAVKTLGRWRARKLFREGMLNKVGASLERSARRGKLNTDRLRFTDKAIKERLFRRYKPFSGKHSFSPGARTAGKVFANVFGKLVLPVYAGMLALNYTDYRIRKHHRENPSDRDRPLERGVSGFFADTWVKARIGAQRLDQSLGILDFHKKTQDLMPGYLRMLGLTLGFAFGMKSAISSKQNFMVSFVNVALRSFIGGALGGQLEKALGYTPEQLERIYSGKEQIAIRKGRWWEFGRSPYEGSKVGYYRQHWYPLMKAGYREEGSLYPSEDWKWQNHWLFGRLSGNKVDPYAWEKKYYEERPYPVTAGQFDDVPMFGPLLNATIGRLTKPRKLMHTEEWMTPSGQAIPQPDETERIRRIPRNAAERLGLSSVGIKPHENIISPDDPRAVAGEQFYRASEFMGLPGYYMQQLHVAATGEETPFEKYSILQTPTRATGFERAYWEKEVGGGLGLTEIFRRFFPHRRRQIDEYNPIANRMGKKHQWIPGPEYFIDFKHGDPFVKIPFGEARLPGKGYEALNEFHSGIPGVYDAMDRFLILADVAPYSEQYKHYRAIVLSWSKAGVLDKTWKEKRETALEQVNTRMQSYEFSPRRFSRIQDSVEEMLSSDNTNKTYSGFQKKVGGAYENLAHGMSNLPIPGVSWVAGKTIAQRTAIEHYERFQVFGAEGAGWAHPIRDFARVYYQEFKAKRDQDYIPTQTQRKWEVEEYFDKLEYIKYKRLEQRARTVGDWSLAKKFGKKSRETMTGLYPGGSWVNIFRAVPKKERDYFTEFVAAEGNERQRILELVPPYMKRIYEGQWQTRDFKKGLEVEAERVRSESIEDMDEYFASNYLPSPNWIGWHPDIDLDKVKLKVVKNEGMDIHDFNLWRTHEQEARREPIPMIEHFDEPNVEYNTPTLRRALLTDLTGRGFRNVNVNIMTQPSDVDEVVLNMNVSLDQSREYDNAMRRMVPELVR